MRLLPAERSILVIILTLAAAAGGLLILKKVAIDVQGFAIVLSVAAGTCLAGQYYRIIRREEALALALMGSGLFTAFTIIGSLFNYTLLPLSRARIDDWLVRADAMFGFNWIAFASWVIQYRWLDEALRLVYMSSLPQLAVIVIVLGCTGRRAQLHSFLLTGVIGALLTIAFWSIFPSAGIMGAYAHDPALPAGLNIVAGREYGLELLKIFEQGADLISPYSALGLIGIPSFHTVMACMSVAYAPRQKVLRPMLIALNVPMAPAVLLHGAHHLMDVLGGLIVFAIACQFSRVLVAAQADRPASALEQAKPA